MGRLILATAFQWPTSASLMTRPAEHATTAVVPARTYHLEPAALQSQQFVLFKIKQAATQGLHNSHPSPRSRSPPR